MQGTKRQLNWGFVNKNKVITFSAPLGFTLSKYASGPASCRYVTAKLLPDQVRAVVGVT